MSQQVYQFQTTVTQDGMIPTPLPPEFYGAPIRVYVEPEYLSEQSPEYVSKQSSETNAKAAKPVKNEYWHLPKSLEQSCVDFLRRQPLSEIIGDKKQIASIDELFPKEQLWENESDFLSFLDAIGRNPDNH